MFKGNTNRQRVILFINIKVTTYFLINQLVLKFNFECNFWIKFIKKGGGNFWFVNEDDDP